MISDRRKQKKYRHISSLVFTWIFILLLLSPVHAEPLVETIFKWKAIESDNFIVYYQPGYNTIAKETIDVLESHRHYVVKFTGNEFEKIPIVLEDLGFNANGFADIGVRKIGLFTASSYPHAPKQEQYYLRRLIIHELTHIGHLTKVSGQHKQTRSIFGNLFYPNLYSPRWLSEGLSVYSESHFSPHEGRLNQGYFHALAKSRAYFDMGDNFKTLNTPFLQFPINKAYLYGGLFMEYLANEYGEESLTEFIDLQSIEPWAYLSLLFPNWNLDNASQKVFGKTFNRLYDDWQDNLKEHAQTWKDPGYRLTRSGWEKQFLTSHDNRIYFTHYKLNTLSPFYYKAEHHLVELNPLEDKQRIIKTYNSPISSHLHIQDNVIFYTRKDVREGYANITDSTYGSTQILFSLDLQTGKEKRVLEDRIDAFGRSLDGTLYYTTHEPLSFISTVWKHTQTGRISKGKINLVINQILVHNDLIFLVGRKKHSSWDIYQLNPETMQLAPILQSPWILSDISISDNRLIFTSNRDKKYTTYAYHLEKKHTQKLTEGDFSNKGIVIDNKVYYVGFSKYGEDIFTHNLTSKETTYFSIKTSSKNKELLPSANYTSREINALNTDLKSLFPYSRLPFLGSDHIGLLNYEILFDTNGQLVSTIQTKLFSPTNLGLTLKNDKTYLSASHLLYKSQLEGLNSVYIGLNTNLEKEHYPYISGTISYPFLDTRTSLTSDMNLGGYSLDSSLNIPLQSFLFSAKSSFHNNFDAYQSLRGFDKLINGSIGGHSYSLQLSHPIMTINQGMWSPNVALGTVFGHLFYDYASFYEHEFSLGYELSIEGSIGENVLIKPSFGIALTGETLEKFYGLSLFSGGLSSFDPFIDLSLTWNL